MKKNNFRKQLAVIVSTALLLNINMFTAYAVENQEAETNTNESSIKGSEYQVKIEVVDQETQKPIEGVHMYMVEAGKQWWEPFDDIIVAEWDTSDVNPFISEKLINPDGQNLGFELRSDMLPEGYLYCTRNHIETEFGTGFDLTEITVELSKGTLDIEDIKDIPLSGTFSLNLNFHDCVSWENVEDLECELYDYNTGEVFAKWNSSEEPEKRIENLPYSFDSYYSINGNSLYCLRFKDPNGKYISLYEQKCEDILISGLTLKDFITGTDIKKSIALENTHYDSPSRTLIATDVAYVTGTGTRTYSTTAKETSLTSDISVSSNSVTSCPESNSAESAPEIVYGDITGDGIVDITDLTELSLYLVKDRDFDENQKLVSDVVYDHNVNLADLALMKQFVSHLSVKLGKN